MRTNSNSTDPEQPYASSCIGSSLDSELIPLESGEACVAAVIFPARIQDFAPASYELKAYWIGRKGLFLD